MAGDLTKSEHLARCFEHNASKIRLTFDDICAKYDREFPNDTIIDLHNQKIVYNKDKIWRMRTRRIGHVAASRGPDRLTRENIAVLRRSLLDDEKSTDSPDSPESCGKSVISANCTLWATEIGEESDPSDAETIESGSDDSNSWEDDEEGEKQKAVGVENGADWYFSGQVDTEYGKWLTIGEKQSLSPQKRPKSQKRKEPVADRFEDKRYRHHAADNFEEKSYRHHQEKRGAHDYESRRARESRKPECSKYLHYHDPYSSQPSEQRQSREGPRQHSHHSALTILSSSESETGDSEYEPSSKHIHASGDRSRHSPSKRERCRDAFHWEQPCDYDEWCTPLSSHSISHRRSHSKSPRKDHGRTHSKSPRKDHGRNLSKSPRNDHGRRLSKSPRKDYGRSLSKSPRKDHGRRLLKSPRNNHGRRLSKSPRKDHVNLHASGSFPGRIWIPSSFENRKGQVPTTAPRSETLTHHQSTHTLGQPRRIQPFSFSGRQNEAFEILQPRRVRPLQLFPGKVGDQGDSDRHIDSFEIEYADSSMEISPGESATAQSSEQTSDEDIVHHRQGKYAAASQNSENRPRIEPLQLFPASNSIESGIGTEVSKQPAQKSAGTVSDGAETDTLYIISSADSPVEICSVDSSCSSKSSPLIVDEVDGCPTLKKYDSEQSCHWHAECQQNSSKVLHGKTSSPKTGDSNKTTGVNAHFTSDNCNISPLRRIGTVPPGQETQQNFVTTTENTNVQATGNRYYESQDKAATSNPVLNNTFLVGAPDKVVRNADKERIFNLFKQNQQRGVEDRPKMSHISAVTLATTAAGVSKPGDINLAWNKDKTSLTQKESNVSANLSLPNTNGVNVTSAVTSTSAAESSAEQDKSVDPLAELREKILNLSRNMTPKQDATPGSANGRAQMPGLLSWRSAKGDETISPLQSSSAFSMPHLCRSTEGLPVASSVSPLQALSVPAAKQNNKHITDSASSSPASVPCSKWSNGIAQKFGSLSSQKLGLVTPQKNTPGSTPQSSVHKSGGTFFTPEKGNSYTTPKKENASTPNKFSFRSPYTPEKERDSTPYKSSSSLKLCTSYFTSPQPKIKIESPQKWQEIKRRYRANSQSLSADDIQRVIDMPDADSAAEFLQQNFIIKAEPPSPITSEKKAPFFQHFYASAESGMSVVTSEKKGPVFLPTLVTAQPSMSVVTSENKTPICHPSPIVGVTVHGSSSLKQAVTVGSSVAESLPIQQNSSSPMVCTAQKMVGEQRTNLSSSSEVLGAFRSSPGENIRHVISNSPLLSTEGKRLDDDSLKQVSEEPGFQKVTSSTGNGEEKNSSKDKVQTSVQKPESVQSPVSRSPTPSVLSQSFKQKLASMSAKFKQQTAALSRSTPPLLWAENTPSASLPSSPVSSAIRKDEQRRLSGSEIHKIFTRLKQASGSKRMHQQKMLPPALPQSHNAQAETGIRKSQSETFVKSTSSTDKYLPSKVQTRTSESCAKNIRSDMAASITTEHSLRPTSAQASDDQTSKFRSLSGKSWSVRRHEKSVPERADAPESLQLLGQLDARGTSCAGSNVPVCRQEDVRQRSTPPQQSSRIPRPSPKGYSLQGQRGSCEKAQQNDTAQKRQNIQKITQSMKSSPQNKANNASLSARERNTFDISQDSSSVTQPDESSGISLSQSGTPSKLLGKLNLSDAHNSSNLSEQCDAISHLMLSSSSATLQTSADKDQKPSFTRIAKYMRDKGVSNTPAPSLLEKLLTSNSGLAETSQKGPPKRQCVSGLPRPSNEKDTKKSHNGVVTVKRESPKTLSNAIGRLASDAHNEKDANSSDNDCSLISIVPSEKCVSLRRAKSKKTTPKSRNSVTVKTEVASSPTLKSADCVLSKPLHLPGSKMIRISSPGAQCKSPRDVYSLSDDSTFNVTPTKRSFEYDFHGVRKSELADNNSPQKRRKMNTIHGTSTPRKSFIRARDLFKMDETLSTICGSDSDAEGTVVSVNEKTLQDPTSSSDSEDEITIISLSV